MQVAWSFSTRASVATLLKMHRCVSSFMWMWFLIHIINSIPVFKVTNNLLFHRMVPPAAYKILFNVFKITSNNTDNNSLWKFLANEMEYSHSFVNSLKLVIQVIFQLIIVIDDCLISSQIALRWMSLDPTDDKSTLVQVMVWCCQATNHYLNQCWPNSLLLYIAPPEHIQ